MEKGKNPKGYIWWHQRRGYIRSVCLGIRFGRGERFVLNTDCQSSDLFRHQHISWLRLTTLFKPVVQEWITFSSHTERTVQQTTALLPSTPSTDWLPKITAQTTHKIHLLGIFFHFKTQQYIKILLLQASQLKCSLWFCHIPLSILNHSDKSIHRK